MSSLRNAVQRRPHRERAQPLERRRLGLLEKHKDYSLRAKDYNEKKKHLKNLRDKAADRNEDEFYFGMMTRKGPGSRLKDGRGWSGTAQGDRGNRAMEVDTVRLLKTQDLGYVRTMRQVAAKELARLEEQLVLAGMRGGEDEDEDGDEEEDEQGNKGKGKTRKIVFLDDEAEREQRVHQHASDGQEKDDDDEDGGGDGDEEQEKKVRRLKMQVEHGRKKMRVLTDAENELGIQRAKMAKTATSGGHTRRGKKIMVRRRKR